MTARARAALTSAAATGTDLVKVGGRGRKHERKARLARHTKLRLRSALRRLAARRRQAGGLSCRRRHALCRALAAGRPAPGAARRRARRGLASSASPPRPASLYL
eukprot:scaffold52544_cov43-Phaeocystis_antarctica.AAC.1